MKKITANLIVETIEPSLEFWVDRLGFESTVQVPHGDSIGFVILKNGATELMLQSVASIKDDNPAIAEESFRSALFIEVDDVNDIEERTKGDPQVCPRRQTFYGADEITVRDPAGNVITFAEFAQEPPE